MRPDTQTLDFEVVMTDLALQAEAVVGAINVEPDVLEKELGILTINNSNPNTRMVQFNTEPTVMYFCFALNNGFNFTDALTNETARVVQTNFRCFVYPRATTQLTLALEGNAKCLILAISLNQMHALFTNAVHLSSEQVAAYRQTRPTVDGIVTPTMQVALHQLADKQLNENFRRLYRVGKVYEFFSLYMDQTRRAGSAAKECPYIANELDVDRINMARQLIDTNLSSPPTIAELAKQIGLNEFKLKMGFKQLYNNTIFGYSFDARMEKARIMLQSNKYQVKEIAYTIGYNNPSHFIAAFKKKFGVTPNRYLEK